MPCIDDSAEILGVGAATIGKKFFGRIELVFQAVIDGVQVNQNCNVESELTSGDIPKADHIDGLIGRDVLMHFELTYNGKTGLVQFKYMS